MRNLLLISAIILSIAACQSSDPPPAAVTPDSETEVAGELEPAVAIGTVRVTASTLNVRGEPSTTAAIVATVRRNQRLDLLARDQGWSRVRISTGEAGWVASRYVREEKGCPPDREFSIAEAPMMRFSDSGARGVVSVEVSVDRGGKVTSTRLLSNETGDESLAFLAQEEIRNARFNPPIRNCQPRAFIYTHRRTF
ncbi:MAG TPA: TonB family protein [Thermoanaerobaculia bacterium]|nr:TonB family protein [Thermoanaerobaculia bacterium]